jgi:mitogen-activated protein kinase kinase kinase
MSGLGIPPGIADPSGHSRSPSSSSFLGAKKLRNIFGTRPPSELITSHLPEFFPFTEKKVLERTARHSMMRSVSKRDSVLTSGDRNSGRVSWNPQSRFSTSSMGSATVPRRSTSPSRTSMSSHPDDENAPTSQNDALSIPRMSISADNGESFDVPEEHSVKRNNPSEGAGHLLPPVQLSTESLSDSLSAGLSAQDGSLFKRSSTAPKRLSFMSELRSRRDRSDTASMLTLDEITAEVQSRFSHDGNPQDEGGGEDPSENGNDDEDEAEDSGAETIEEVDNGAESEKADQPVEDEEIAQAVTSTGGTFSSGRYLVRQADCKSSGLFR